MFIDRAPIPLTTPDSGNDNLELPGRFPAATLLAALQTSLHETITQFGEVSGKISERVLKHGLMSDVELIVGLQGLDRLQQELDAYAAIVNHCAIELSNPDESEMPADPIGAITLADLKKRLHDRCRNEVAMVSSGSGYDNF